MAMEHLTPAPRSTSIVVVTTHLIYPIESMNGIFAYIYHVLKSNEGKYTIRGSYTGMLINLGKPFPSINPKFHCTHHWEKQQPSRTCIMALSCVSLWRFQPIWKLWVKNQKENVHKMVYIEFVLKWVGSIFYTTDKYEYRIKWNEMKWVPQTWM